MDFNDLARSGTAPEPSKTKASQMTGPMLNVRPKTRGADNDMQDFRIELRTNKIGHSQNNYYLDTSSSGNDPMDGQNDEFIRAMESYQADIESWSRARTDFDPSAMSNANTKQNTSLVGRRPTSNKDGKKVQSLTVSAYTQNVPQIVLQTSKKGVKPTLSPRTIREPKADARADIRAAYGADFLERANVSAQRPRSQKQHSNPHSPKVSEELAPSSPEREEYTSEIRPQSGSDVSAPTVGRSSSASRLRANMATPNPYLTGKTASARGGKAVPSTSSGSRPSAATTTATRPFSHNEGVSRTSVSQGATVGTAPTQQQQPRSSAGATTESFATATATTSGSTSTKRVSRKQATNTGNASLLKTSLAPAGTRGTSGRAERTTSASDSSDTSRHDIDDRSRDYATNEEQRDYNHSEDSLVQERRAKQPERAVTADHALRRHPPDPAHNYAYTQSSSHLVDADGGLHYPHATVPGHENHRDGIASGLVASIAVAGLTTKSPVKEPSGSKRTYSQSPTLNMDGSEQAFLGIIHDTDALECSFDESPILAAYLQQKNHHSHTTAQQESPSDGSTRPQSRKLYLGVEKELAGSISSTKHDKETAGKSSSYKTAPRSAGARYPIPHSPAGGSGSLSATNSAFVENSPPPLRKMSSFNEIKPQNRKWQEIPATNNNLPDLRPHSRQSSAFPVHLADEPPPTTAGAGATTRSDENNPHKIAVTSSVSKSMASPPAVSSMRWHRVDGEEEEEDAEIEESLHQDGAHSDASNEFDDRPVVHSHKAPKVTAPSATLRASPSHGSIAAAPLAPAPAVAPARTHIGIVRSAPPPDERPTTANTNTNASGADLYSPEYTLHRPPSRQKIAAQHLFENGPPPSRMGSEKDSQRGGRATTAGDPSVESLPMSRSGTRPSTVYYNPRDDGFTDLDGNDAVAAPFLIKFNNTDPDFEEYDLEDLALGQSRSQAQYGREGPRRKSQGQGQAMIASHSRSNSNNSGNWADLAEDGGGHLTSGQSLNYRPQTMGSGVKAPRLLNAMSPTGILGQAPVSVSMSSSFVPPRSKTAGEGIKSPVLPVRREGNNFLLQQPHAPVGGGGPRGNPVNYGVGHILRESKSGDYTAGPAANRGVNSGWTDATVSPRAQNVKIVEAGLHTDNTSSSGILQMRSVSHSPSGLKLGGDLGHGGGLNGVRDRGMSHDEDLASEDDDNDDITIMTEDSGRHCMESGMSMHSLALDSSLGEDFLSLFAPGPP